MQSNIHTLEFNNAHYKQIMANTFETKHVKQIKILPTVQQKYQHQIPCIIPSLIKHNKQNKLYKIIVYQKYLRIYKLEPSVAAYEFQFKIMPIGLHIIDNTIYILINNHTLYATQFGKQQQIVTNISKLQNASHIYQMYTGNNLKEQILKIAYWKNGFGVYQHNNKVFKFSNPIKYIFQNPHHEFKVIHPDILGYVVTHDQILKFINLDNYCIVGQEISLKHLNLKKLKVTYTFRSCILDNINGIVEFLLCLYKEDSTKMQIYKISLNLVKQLSTKMFYLDSFLTGTVFQNINIVQLTQLSFEGILKNVLLTFQGFFVTIQKSLISSMTNTMFYQYDQIQNFYQLETLDIWIQKYYIEDQDETIDLNVLRNRLVLPDRYPFNFLNKIIRQNDQTQSIYSKLKNMNQQKLIILQKKLRLEWYSIYRFQEVIEFCGSIYIIRKNSVSVLVSYPKSFFSYYYENYVKIYHQLTDYLINDHEISILSQFSQKSSWKKLKANQFKASISAQSQFYPQCLQKSLPNSTYQCLYKQIMNHFHQAKQYNIRIMYSQVASIKQNYKTSVLNVLLGKSRHYIKVVSDLLCKFYSHTTSDFSFSDKEVIPIIARVNKLINTPIQIFRGYYKQISEEYLFYDILSSFLTVNISLLHLSDYQDESDFQIIQTLTFNNLLKLTTYNQQNTVGIKTNCFIVYLVQSIEKGPFLLYYGQQMLQSLNLEINEDYLKLCLLTHKQQLFRSKIIKLISQDKVYCKQIINILQPMNRQSLNIKQYQRGRAILQYIGMIINEQPDISGNDLISLIEKRSLLQRLFYKPDNHNFQFEIQQKLQFLDQLYEDLKQKKLYYLIQQNVLNLNSESNIILQQYNQYNKSSELFIIYKKLFVFQCRILALFADYMLNIPHNLIIKFLDDMIGKLKSIIHHYKILNPNQSNIEQKIFYNPQQRIFKKTPKVQLLFIIKQSQLMAQEDYFLPYQTIPKYAIKKYIQSTSQEFLIKLLKYYNQKTIINAFYDNKIMDLTQLPSQARSILSYSISNFQKKIGQEKLAKMVLQQIKSNHSIYRCAQRQTF